MPLPGGMQDTRTRTERLLASILGLLEISTGVQMSAAQQVVRRQRGPYPVLDVETFNLAYTEGTFTAVVGVRGWRWWRPIACSFELQNDLGVTAVPLFAVVKGLGFMATGQPTGQRLARVTLEPMATLTSMHADLSLGLGSNVVRTGSDSVPHYIGALPFITVLGEGCVVINEVALADLQVAQVVLTIEGEKLRNDSGAS